MLHLQDNIDRILDRNSAAYLTLTVYRDAVKRFFGIDRLPMIQSQDVKREVRRKAIGSENDQVSNIYPYAYFNITSLGLVKDHLAVKTVARASRGFTMDELSEAVIKKAYMFPATIEVELHYVTNDLIRAIDFSTRALIVAATGKLNARVTHDGISWVIATSFAGDSISFPRPDKDLEEDPEGYDIIVPCTISTQLGVMRDVPKINNRGKVTTQLEVENGSQ